MDAKRAAILVFLALMLVSNASAGQATLRGPQQIPFGTDLIVEAIHLVDGAALDNVVVSVNSSGNRIDIVQTATVYCPRPGSATAFSEVNLGRMPPGTYTVNATSVANPVGFPDPFCTYTRNASLLIAVLPDGGTVRTVPAHHGLALLLLSLMVALAAAVRLGNRGELGQSLSCCAHAAGASDPGRHDPTRKLIFRFFNGLSSTCRCTHHGICSQHMSGRSAP